LAVEICIAAGKAVMCFKWALEMEKPVEKI